MFSQLLRLSKHSVVYGLGVAVSQVVGFLLIPLYTRYLTPDDYGALAIFQVTVSVLGVVFFMGLGSALFRSYYRYEDAEARKRVVSTAFIFLSLTSLVLTSLLVSLAGSFSPLLFGSGEYATHFRIIFGTLFFDTGMVLTFAVFRAREEPTKYAIVSLLRLVMGIGLNIVFVVVLQRGVLGILEAGLITVAVLYLALIASVIGRAGFGFSLDELKRMLAFGLPLVPAGLAGWILTMADRYFLQFMSTPEELGLYSLGYRFGLVINALLVQPFNLAWAPFVFSIARQETAKQTYSRVLTYFLLVAVFVALALSVLAREVLAIMATPAFHSAYRVVPLIALSYVLYGAYFVLSVGVSLEAKTKYMPFLVGAAAVLNLGLDYALIPGYGMMGAAIATVISYLVLPIGSFLISRRFYVVTYEWGRVAKIFAAAGLVYVASIFVGNSYAAVHSYVVVGAFKLLTLLAFPILLYLLRFFQPEEMRKAREIARAAPGALRAKLRMGSAGDEREE